MMKKTPEETTRRGDVSAKRNKVEIRLRFFFFCVVCYNPSRIGNFFSSLLCNIGTRRFHQSVYAHIHCSGHILSVTRTDDIIVQFLIRRRKRNSSAEPTETVKYAIINHHNIIIIKKSTTNYSEKKNVCQPFKFCCDIIILTIGIMNTAIVCI